MVIRFHITKISSEILVNTQLSKREYVHYQPAKVSNIGIGIG